MHQSEVNFSAHSFIHSLARSLAEKKIGFGLVEKSMAMRKRGASFSHTLYTTVPIAISRRRH